VWYAPSASGNLIQMVGGKLFFRNSREPSVGSCSVVPYPGRYYGTVGGSDYHTVFSNNNDFTAWTTGRTLELPVDQPLYFVINLHPGGTSDIRVYRGTTQVNQQTGGPLWTYRADPPDPNNLYVWASGQLAHSTGGGGTLSFPTIVSGV